MALLRLKKAYPNYRDTFSDSNLSNIDDYSVYTRDNDKVGSVEDGLFEDGTGRFRYLVVDTGPWIFGKKVLLPIGLANFDYDNQRIHVEGLTKQQIEELPEYKTDMMVDHDYEERLRGTYRTLPGRSQTATGRAAGMPAAGTSAPVTGTAATGATANTAYTRDNYSYDDEPAMYGVDENDVNHPIRLYEERLIADKHRTKTGEVSVGKRVETESAEVSVPVERERVVIERTNPTNTTAATDTPDFREGEVARMEVHEENADIHKEAFVREEVNVRKEVDRDVVSDRETVRREEIDVDTSGNPDIRRS
ncbi:DUF2382 domain-containing protein [Romeria aff. gracilis LEGE 07310]|uniref:DUF2382 domain-containing protein n=1 Tax=Vasconcelosia minhoensis LEGE 07310 TaxID=915328 RepID=A0A8J7ASL7_9CYAN|nr:DUF2382 domain-containing protein [Romeria gracilis]MBE9079981.1 DUF2382 domain-containing protein [Romeria aff. gracilis LEGE 07310]